MTETPFHDTAKIIAKQKGFDFILMQVGCDGVRSHSWWRNLVNHGGAWKGSAGTRVGPPGPETIPGIAKLFGTSAEQVAAMIAADWYGVHPDTEISTRVRRLAPALEALSEGDAELVDALARRLA